MKNITAVDLELKKMLRKEIYILKEYEDMLCSMTLDEKEELREWMAHGKSVNSNPCMLYDEKGCLTDFIAAIRIEEDMCNNPDDHMCNTTTLIDAPTAIPLPAAAGTAADF